jgi:coiled-coil domain-containing protein 61
VNELNSANQWKGAYDANYIEELTRKTGNFKSFPIFVNMLITALKQESESVSLDLLTFSDLEMLRNKKAAASSRPAADTRNQNQNNQKRVLILTYNVEFDRINYPLQLNFIGKLDPIDLLNTVKLLKLKLNQYEMNSNNGADSVIVKENNNNELIRLKNE